jgi:hypothetical protein
MPKTKTNNRDQFINMNANYKLPNVDIVASWNAQNFKRDSAFCKQSEYTQSRYKILLCPFDRIGVWVTRFFLLHENKPEKYTKLTQNVPNGHKLTQMFVKYFKWP